MSDSQTLWTKEEMRKRMEKGLAQFLELLDQLSDDQMLIPRDAAGWNIRDHVTHLAVWADGIAALLRREDRWKAMGLVMDNPEGDEPDYDLMNRQIVEQHQDISPAKARAWLIEAHERVLKAMEALPEAELSAPYERFVAPYTGNWGHAIAEYLLGNTEDHYDEHTSWIRAIVQGSAASSREA
jgi:hypothetical protein